MYAYAQKGVEHVELKIDVEKEKPFVQFNVRLTPSDRLKWMAIKKASEIKNPILRKMTLLALRKAGAPLHIDRNIMELAKAYLPERYSVEVKIVE